MKKIFFLSYIAIIAAFTSCEKNELKLPVEVMIEFDMNSFNLEENSKAGQFFNIDEAYLVVSAIEFDGKREQGEDYFFSSTFDLPVEAEMHNGTANQVLAFDVPQGIYNMIELNISVGGGESNTALMLRGRFQQGPFLDIPVRFEYAFSEQIRVRAKNKEGSRQIILKKEEPSSATILLDIPFMFQLFNMGLIMNAQHYLFEGEETIIINNEKNTEIFNLLATRLDKSLQVIFE
ncbi:MAG: hypothetical protein KFF49_12780 [Bacteroidales bacterium]|nr:hypothetical protein [Bacteroidales bacterium]